MARAIRVMLEPIPRPRPAADSTKQNLVKGAHVSFTRRGGGRSQATPGDPVPAKLIFHVLLFKRIRGAAPEKTTKVATLEGTVALRGSSRSPAFINGQDASGQPNTLQYEDPTLADGGSDPTAGNGSSASSASTTDADTADANGDGNPPPPRMLDLDFDSSSFEGMEDLEGHNSRLLLPDDVNHFHFLELDTELEINSATEQALGVSDRRDVRLTRLAPPFAPAFTVRLFDEVGEPLDGVTLSFARDGKTDQRTTDANGFARLVAPNDETAAVTIVDSDALRDTLRARWNNVRGKPLIEVGPDVQIVEPRHLDDPLEVTPDGPLFVCVRPRVILARLLSMFFDTNKSFLLPSIMPTIGELKKLYADNPNSDLLVVGHADTTGGASINDPLSLQRAEMVSAFLIDDVQPWLKQYDASSQAQRWGAIEDSLMIQSMPDFGTKPASQDDVTWYQSTRGLVVDGKAGKNTRTQLITEYMSLDGTSLPPDIDFVTHGAGENFPLDPSGQELDPAPPDETSDPLDRRVELFFFENEFGIQPPPPGKNSRADSKEYPEWRHRASQVEQFDGTLPRLLRIRVLVNGQLIANTPVQLFVDDVLAASRSTDANGFLETPISPAAKTAAIQIPSLNISQTLKLVDPKTYPNINTVSGVQQRLAQLGFYQGVVDGRPNGETAQAIQSFKTSKGLASDSVIDVPTRNALAADYGS